MLALFVIHDDKKERHALCELLHGVYGGMVHIVVAEAVREALDRVHELPASHLVLVDMDQLEVDESAVASMLQIKQAGLGVIVMGTPEQLLRMPDIVAYGESSALRKPVRRDDLIPLIDQAMLRAETLDPDQADAPAALYPHRGLLDRIQRALLDRKLECAMCYANTALDALYFALRTPKAVLQAVRQFLLQQADAFERDAHIKVNISALLSMFDGEDIAQPVLSARIRALYAGWLADMNGLAGDRIRRTRQDIEAYIRANYARNLSLKTIARELHFSEPYFSRLFFRCFQQNFIAYLTDVRLRAASAMLRGSSQGIAETGAAVGYPDANYFAKVFRKAYGVCPSEYRRQNVGVRGE